MTRLTSTVSPLCTTETQHQKVKSNKVEAEETNLQYHIYCDTKKRQAKNWKKAQSVAIYRLNLNDVQKSVVAVY